MARTQPRVTEMVLHRAVMDHLAIRAFPGVLAWHTPNGGWRTPTEAAILKGMGTRAGVSDILAVYDGDFFALELKSQGRKPSPAQLDFIAAVNNAGGFATWADNLDRAVNILTMWGLLRPESGRVYVA
jgi:hypothetical protein